MVKHGNGARYTVTVQQEAVVLFPEQTVFEIDTQPAGMYT